MMKRPDYINLDGNNCFLRTDYTFQAFDKCIVIPSGFLFDGASIPIWVIPFVGLQRFGKHDPASLIHDYLYENEGRIKECTYTRKQADKLLLSHLVECGVKVKVAKRVYKLVRIFGLIYWFSFN